MTKITAETETYGLHMVVLGTHYLNASANVQGISAQAGEKILATANGDFTYCGGTSESVPFAIHYRLAPV